jgi:outer membrane protein
MSLTRFFVVAAAMAALFPRHAQAAAPPLPWIVELGAHDVDPKSDNGQLAGGALDATVGSSIRPTLSLEYRLTPELGAELLAAWPFEHQVKLNGAHAADVKELPPTLSLQYHFDPAGTVSPFLGIGVNYTRFFHIDETGPLSGARLNLDSSVGFAAHAGLNWRIDERWLAGVDLRWINITSDAKVNGTKVGTVHIDPLVYGLYAGYRF